PSPPVEVVADCERLAELDARLPAILRGEDKPSDARAQTEFARVCTLKQLHAAAARLYQEALSAKPEPTGLFPSAARAAALAGCGLGQDAGELDERERARWRKQALDWLQADLASWDPVLQRNASPIQEAARSYLELRQRDPALAGLRDAAAL